MKLVESFMSSSSSSKYDCWTAACEGDVETLATALHERKKLIHAKDCDGKSLLFLAAYNGHLEAVRVLLDHGAKDADGEAAAHAMTKACRNLIQQRQSARTFRGDHPQQAESLRNLCRLSLGLIEEKDEKNEKIVKVEEKQEVKGDVQTIQLTLSFGKGMGYDSDATPKKSNKVQEKPREKSVSTTKLSKTSLKQEQKKKKKKAAITDNKSTSSTQAKAASASTTASRATSLLSRRKSPRRQRQKSAASRLFAPNNNNNNNKKTTARSASSRSQKVRAANKLAVPAASSTMTTNKIEQQQQKTGEQQETPAPEPPSSEKKTTTDIVDSPNENEVELVCWPFASSKTGQVAAPSSNNDNKTPGTEEQEKTETAESKEVDPPTPSLIQNVLSSWQKSVVVSPESGEATLKPTAPSTNDVGPVKKKEVEPNTVAEETTKPDNVVKKKKKKKSSFQKLKKWTKSSVLSSMPQHTPRKAEKKQQKLKLPVDKSTPTTMVKTWTKSSVLASMPAAPSESPVIVATEAVTKNDGVCTTLMDNKKVPPPVQEEKTVDSEASSGGFFAMFQTTEKTQASTEKEEVVEPVALQVEEKCDDNKSVDPVPACGIFSVLSFTKTSQEEEPEKPVSDKEPSDTPSTKEAAATSGGFLAMIQAAKKMSPEQTADVVNTDVSSADEVSSEDDDDDSAGWRDDYSTDSDQLFGEDVHDDEESDEEEEEEEEEESDDDDDEDDDLPPLKVSIKKDLKEGFVDMREEGLIKAFGKEMKALFTGA